MARKRKYARAGEAFSKYECINRKCKWQGTLEEQHKRKLTLDSSMEEYICPKCGRNTFYTIL